MKNNKNYEYLLKDLTYLKGVGIKTMEILKKKKINNLFDLLWRLPKSYIDRTETSKINKLQIGKTHTIKVIPIKYSHIFLQMNLVVNPFLCFPYIRIYK